MHHFAHLGADVRERLFSIQPREFGRSAELETLSIALGATLYLPATRARLADDLVRRGDGGVISCVVCLEDSIADADVPAAFSNALGQLREFADRTGGRDEDGPLVFVRVREPGQITDLVDALGDATRALSGFVLPKFTDANGEIFLSALGDAEHVSGQRLFAMPVIESPAVIHCESRIETLIGIERLLAKHRDRVLAVRIGATDLCAAYGIRRSRDLTIYEVGLVAGVIADVVNVLGRAGDGGFVVTGPVWEYFQGHERLFKPQLRQSPFEEVDARSLRHQLITRDLDGLIREVVLDKANGLIGKTVIHPSHVIAVHALSVVTREEYDDACDIVGADAVAGGARASSYHNKMNESRPHRAWAERTIARAGLFGVAAADVSFVDLLAAGADA
ncbi:MAG: HpcH/HpaI aldolase/citrate lyase family protein [Nocardioidaceae bacterium]